MGRESWLKERAKGVGASEVAAILGEDPRRGALAIYADKVAGKPPEDEEEWLSFGRDVESAIARGYSRKTGRPILPRTEFEIVKHPDLAILGATLDFEISASDKYPAPGPGDGVLETKAVGFHKAHEWASEPPLMFAIQVQVQMACRGRAWGSLGALMGGIQIAEPVDMTPNPAFMTVVMERVERFWWHVEHQVPPEVDAKPETRAAIRRLWGGDADKAIALEDADVEVVNLWEVAKALKDRTEDEYDLIVNKLAVRMGDASTGHLPDGSAFIYSVETVKASACACGKQLRKEFTRRVPRRWWPQHLRLKKGGK